MARSRSDSNSLCFDRMRGMNWLFKEEPANYSFDAFTKDKRTTWSGVRNPVAQRNLHAVKRGDRVLRNTGQTFRAFMKDGFDMLYREGKTQPKMLSFGLHLRPFRPLAFQLGLLHLRPGLRPFAFHLFLFGRDLGQGHLVLQPGLAGPVAQVQAHGRRGVGRADEEVGRRTIVDVDPMSVL